MRVKRVLLEDERGIASRGRLSCHIASLEAQDTRVGPLEAGNETQCRGLARAGRSQQYQELAVADFERQFGHRHGRTEALGDALA
jgi:hypothetical protein